MKLNLTLDPETASMEVDADLEGGSPQEVLSLLTLGALSGIYCFAPGDEEVEDVMVTKLVTMILSHRASDAVEEDADADA